MDYYEKYVKYKTKYINLKGQGKTTKKLPMIIQLNIGSHNQIVKYGFVDEIGTSLFKKRYMKIIFFINECVKYTNENNTKCCICLQEVTPEFINLLEVYLNNDYTYTTTPINIKCNQNTRVNNMNLCFVYSKFMQMEDLTNNFNDLYKEKYNKCDENTCNVFLCQSQTDYCENTICNTRIQIIKIKYNDIDLIIVNVHLPGLSESFDDHNKKIYLINNIKSYLTTNKHNNFIVIGDYNDENIKDISNKTDLQFYDHKNIKTSFHQIILKGNFEFDKVKNYDNQRQTVDHILTTKNIKVPSIQYIPQNGIEIKKQYPYDGMNAYRFFINNNTINGKENKELEEAIKSDMNKKILEIAKNCENGTCNFELSDHTVLIFTPSIEIK